MSDEIMTTDRLIDDVRTGRISRRDLIKTGAALGFSAPFLAALLNLSSTSPASAQSEITLSFDAGATGGGGGKPTEDILSYCRVVNGGSQFELDRMVDIRLVTLSADLKTYVGELAESWEIADTTATFKLRAGATWHDGQPLTAKDVVYTINTLSDPATASRWAANFKSIVGYDELAAGTAKTLTGVTAPDDLTVKIELSQIDSGLLPGFIFVSILPEHIYTGTDLTKFCEAPNWTQNRVGAGPFKFVKIVPNERIEMDAFDGYVLGRPKIDKLNLLFFTSFETSLAAFQQGSNLAAPMTVLNLDLVQDMDTAEIVTTPAGVGAIWVNTKQPEFTDKRVRQAISYAIDRKTITENLFRGYADPVSTEIPYLTWTQPADANPYDYDPEKAKSLLTEAGFTGGKTFKLWYYYPDELTKNVMEACQQYLDAVGIKVDIVFDDASGVRQKEFDDGTWQLIYGSYGAQANPAALSIIFGSAAEDKYTFANADFDAAMEAGLRTYDQEEQATHYQAAIKILNEELPWVWLFDRKNLIAVSKKLVTGDVPAWGPGSILYANHAQDWTIME